jgi:hypothetical protein
MQKTLSPTRGARGGAPSPAEAPKRFRIEGQASTRRERTRRPLGTSWERQRRGRADARSVKAMRTAGTQQRGARSSSRASVRPDSPETTASTGSSSAPVDLPHPCAPLSCMESGSPVGCHIAVPRRRGRQRGSGDRGFLRSTQLQRCAPGAASTRTAFLGWSRPHGDAIGQGVHDRGQSRRDTTFPPSRRPP